MAEVMSQWLYRQFESLIQTRPDLVEPILTRAMREDEAVRWAVVVGAHIDEQISLAKAAELLGMHRLDLQRLFLEKGIPLRLGPATIEEAKAEVAAWAAWVRPNQNG